jgi:hypothetical protein
MGKLFFELAPLRSIQLKKIICNLCGNKPKKDHIALNKKLLGINIDYISALIILQIF